MSFFHKLNIKFKFYEHRQALINIYKAFVRSHLNYGDILYGQTYNVSFHEKLEYNAIQCNANTIKYNACIAITGAIRGTSKENMYQELGLESLESRSWYRKLCFFFKILKNKSPDYLSKKNSTKEVITYYQKFRRNSSFQTWA